MFFFLPVSIFDQELIFLYIILVATKSYNFYNIATQLVQKGQSAIHRV